MNTWPCFEGKHFKADQQGQVKKCIAVAVVIKFVPFALRTLSLSCVGHMLASGWHFQMFGTCLSSHLCLGVPDKLHILTFAQHSNLFFKGSSEKAPLKVLLLISLTY